MKIRRKYTLTAAVCIIAALSGFGLASAQEKVDNEEHRLTEWLYSCMPLPDSLGFSRGYWTDNVKKTLEVRKRMGWRIPEREFLHFVLPTRVNNEDLDDFRTVMADTLCTRVKGMSLHDAALEINHWCHEQATYEPSDARTSSPLATVRRGKGRCGEESVLTVAALRAAGIPARQVYTPRWAHTDDNHAWVEVWIDGKWHFMGACEPEAGLDMAWFNGPVSRAMILHTKVAGDYYGDEDVISRNSCYTEINVIRGYVPAGRARVRVEYADGCPAEGASVDFGIYNYGEFYTIATYTSDCQGNTGIDCGHGDMYVMARKDGMFGFGKSSPDGEIARIVLDHKFGECFSSELDIVPPPENPLPSEASAQEIELNNARLAEEDLIRNSHDHRNPDVERFLSKYRPRKAKRILNCLNAKDLGDVSYEVLQDAAKNCRSRNPMVLGQRIEREPLLPFRAEMLSAGISRRIRSGEDALRWVRDSITLVRDRNPQRLRTAPILVWHSRKADEIGRDIFFVALCRTVGIPARIDEVTSKVQYRRRGRWTDVDFGDSAKSPEVSPKGLLKLKRSEENEEGKILYYRHFTISSLSPDGRRLLEFGTDADESPIEDFARGVELDCGYYVLDCGTRLADGSVLSRSIYFNIEENRGTEVEVRLRKRDDAVSVIGAMDAEKCFSSADGEYSLLSAAGRGWFMVTVLGPEGDEPSSHVRKELGAAAETLNGWGRKIIVLGHGRHNPEAIPSLINAVYGCNGKAVADMIADGCGRQKYTLPLTAVCDSFGRVVYISTGYDTSMASNLQHVISGLNP